MTRVVWPMETQFGVQQMDWRGAGDSPALGLTSRFWVQCQPVPAKAVPSTCRCNTPANVHYTPVMLESQNSAELDVIQLKMWTAFFNVI